MATKKQTDEKPVEEPKEDAPVDSGDRFLGMIRDHIAMGTATQADLKEWKRRLGK